MEEQQQLTGTIVIGGIDAHSMTHHVVALGSSGRRLGSEEFPASNAGYLEALIWLASFGVIDKVGIESTGSYAAGLTRFLLSHDVEVVEVNQPHPCLRARRGKDDAIDAEAAALKALAGQATVVPKLTTGVVESIRILRVSRDSAIRSRTRAQLQLRDLLITAPAELREQITERTTAALIDRYAGLCPDRGSVADRFHATKYALRVSARRVIELTSEIREVDMILEDLVGRAAPTLVSKLAIGPGHAAQLLINHRGEEHRPAHVNTSGRVDSLPGRCGWSPARKAPADAPRSNSCGQENSPPSSWQQPGTHGPGINENYAGTSVGFKSWIPN